VRKQLWQDLFGDFRTQHLLMLCNHHKAVQLQPAPTTATTHLAQHRQRAPQTLHRATNEGVMEALGAVALAREGLGTTAVSGTMEVSDIMEALDTELAQVPSQGLRSKGHQALELVRMPLELDSEVGNELRKLHNLGPVTLRQLQQQRLCSLP
jgi:hypothetical protein